MVKRAWSWCKGLGLAGGLAMALAGWPGGVAAAGPPALDGGAPLRGRCLGNHDGDTLRVELGGGRVERVRLLGVDTPELAQGHWAQQARAFTSRWVHGKDLVLTFDRQTRDRHRRLLAYVWVDGRLLNLALVEAGLATTLDYAPNHAHAPVLAAALAKAQASKVGMWQAVGGLRESPLDFRRRTRGQGGSANAPQGPSGSPPAFP